MRNHVELISAHEELYGLRFSYDARFTSLEGDRSLTSPACYLSTEFGEHVGPTIRAGVTARATGTGRANAVRVTYEIQFADGLWVDKADRVPAQSSDHLPAAADRDRVRPGLPRRGQLHGQR
jgi:hypothetical protein